MVPPAASTGGAGPETWSAFRGGASRAGGRPVTDGPEPPVETAWTVDLPGTPYPSFPTVVGDSVYVGYGDEVIAYDAATGEPRSTHDSGEITSYEPVRVGDILYLLVSHAEYMPRRTALHLLAVDVPSGDHRWTFPVEDDVDDLDTPLAPVAADGTAVYLRDNAGVLHAIDPETGDARWDREVGEPGGSSLALGDGQVHVAGEGTLRAVETDTGTERWRSDVGIDRSVGIPGSPVVDEGLVYYPGTDNQVYALDAGSGDLIWEFSPPSQRGLLLSSTESLVGSPAVSDGVAAVTTEAALYGLDATTGERRWRYAGEPPPWVGRWTTFPVVVDGVVYREFEDGIHAIDAKTGQQRWQVDAWENFAVVDGGLYGLSIGDRVLYALE